jgi:WD40 repeat protein/outer membrane protein assembly factor BamD (BamD/ComL family)
MAAKPAHTTDGLRTMLVQALEAYELAQITQVQAEHQAKTDQRQHLDTLQKQQQAQLQQVETDQKHETAIAKAEQERIGQLLTLIRQVKQGAIDLLEKAGLAHISGAPLRLDESAAPSHLSGEAVSKAFASAQVAYVELRTALFRLSLAYAEAAQWDEARRIVEPLLKDTQTPLYSDARELFCETCYQPAVLALQTDDWNSARQGFEAVIKVNATYRDVGKLLRETYLCPAQNTLRAGRLHEARRLLEEWLKSHQDDTEIRDLLCETYYQPALDAMRAGDWVVARQNFENILNIDRSYRDTTARLRKTYLFPSSAALKTGHLDEACQRLEAWVPSHQNDTEMRDLLCEAYYQQVLLSINNKDWEYAANRLKQIYSLKPNYRDVIDLLRRYPSLIWLKGSCSAIKEFNGQGNQEQVRTIAYSPNAQFLAMGYKGGIIKMCDAATQQILYPLVGHAGIVSSVSFSPDGRLLVSGGNDGSVKIWDVKTGQMLNSQNSGQRILDLAFSADGRLFTSRHNDQTIKIWDITSVRIIQNLSGNIMAFSPDGQYFALGSTDFSVKLGMVPGGRIVQSMLGHSNAITRIFFSPDQRCLASVSQDSTIKIWDVAAHHILYTLDGYNAAFSPDGQLLASVSSDSTVKLQETVTHQLIHVFSGQKVGVNSMLFSPDGQLLALGYTDNAVKVFDAVTGQALHTLRKHAQPVTKVIFSPDGLLLASLDQGGVVNVWKPEI